MTARLRKIFATALLCGLSSLPVLTSGCGGAEEVATEPKNTATGDPASVKKLLLNVADSGTLGSAVMSIRDELNELKATDAAKADALLQDLAQMAKTTDPDQIKSQARAMADKL